MNALKYLLVIVVVIILGVVGYLAYQNSSLFRVQVEKTVKPEEVSITNWGIYKNGEYGLEMAYPSEFSVDESYANSRYYHPVRVRFDSRLVRLGHFGLTIYDTTKAKITSLDNIPRLTKEDADRKVISSKDITNANGIAIRVVKGQQYPYEKGTPNTRRPSETVSIVWIQGSNAYVIEWSCWSLQTCFSDQILDKVVQNIKFTK